MVESDQKTSLFGASERAFRKRKAFLLLGDQCPIARTVSEMFRRPRRKQM
jgi:hypothetical protein